MGRDTYSALGEVIKTARVSMALTREQFGEMIELSPRQITSIENESKNPSYDTLVKMIRTLGIDANTIFYPENTAPDTLAGQISRLLPQCGERELRAIAAFVQTFLTGA